MLASSSAIPEHIRGGSLTEAALGGWTCPVPEYVQPLGRDVLAVTEAEGTQGQTLGTSKVEVSR